MSTTLLPPPLETRHSNRAPDDDAALGESASEKYSAARVRGGVSFSQLGLIAGFCLLFMYHNYLPLFHSDLWGHVSYGEWIWQHRQLPTEDPFTPLAEGVPLVASAWLSQVLFAAVAKSGDVEWIAHLFALTVLVTQLLLMSAFRRRGASPAVAAFSVAAAFAIAWSRHAVQRPEVFGSLCFAALLWLISTADAPRRMRPGWRTAAAIFVLFALWGNLHGSFVMGFAVLGCLWLGRIVDVWLIGGVSALWRGDAVLHQRLIWLELAVAGTIINPYGIDLLVYAIAFPGHPNLRAVLEWFPLEMNSLEGIPMAASWVLTAVVLRHSHRRMTPSEVLLLLVFNAAVCARVRMIAWYAPVLIWTLSPHLTEIATRWSQSVRWERWQETLSRPSPRIAAVAVLVVWMTFALSPISRPILGGKPRPPRQVFSHDTPLGVTAYLREHPVTGMVAAPQWWGDWLSRHSSPGLQLMATTNAIHLLPNRVWNDYLAISTAEGGLERRLDRYRINTVIIGKALQPELERTMTHLPGWRTVYEDDIGLVSVRTRALSESPSGSAAAPQRVSRDDDKLSTPSAVLSQSDKTTGMREGVE